MLAVGNVVEVEVTSVKVFGAFCRHDSTHLLVLIPETSWIASFNSCTQFAAVGDRLTVKINHIHEPSSTITGSVKALHPDPWPTNLLAAGSRHDARIVRYVDRADRCNDQPAYLIELVPGAYTMLPADGLDLQPDDKIAVTIESSNVERHAVVVRMP